MTPSPAAGTRPERTRRNSPGRDRLNRTQLVDSAIAVADAEGLDAVTIRRIAAEHGVTAMALYWHFKDKDELLDAIAERLFADTTLPPIDSRPWDEQLTTIFESFLSAVRPHPAVAGLAMRRVFSSPAGLDVAERTLTELRRGGFSLEQASDIACYVLAALIALVTADPCHPSSGADDDELLREKKALLGSLSAEQYPNIVASAGLLTGTANPDNYFAIGVRQIVGGIRATAP
jgi:TetR/AcrR family transcriptional regulator, tetracycline repressor protein